METLLQPRIREQQNPLNAPAYLVFPPCFRQEIHASYMNFRNA